MIQANELRVGNWVVYGEIEKVHLQVKNISETEINKENKYDEDTHTYYSDSYLLTEVEPIPLTPELLEKCGFSKVNDTCFQYTENDEWNSTSIIFWDDVNKCWTVPYCNYKYGIYTLHQLQNLYFALTGKELTILL